MYIYHACKNNVLWGLYVCPTHVLNVINWQKQRRNKIIGWVIIIGTERLYLDVFDYVHYLVQHF